MSTIKPKFSSEFDMASGDVSMGNEEARVNQVNDDASYVCDNCGEEIVIPVDLAGGQDQTYVEDCPVCCSPSVIHVRVEDDHVDVDAKPEQDRF